MAKKYKLVEVFWEDSCYHSGWKTKSEKIAPSNCRTVGYLVRDTKGFIAIAMSVSDGGSSSETMCIPRKVLLSKRKIG